ncbi:hypothetical protein G7Y89_g272 [Cudoniella acicularis]|uniref:Uncharacterized protein n=1 Tax=Cudoniella acicularis TaxID=354080 RepID=A0A8H4RYC1_9HELO|nr:hypothetical protein G7Y89_g272 [Cudoniella acicularis]
MPPKNKGRAFKSSSSSRPTLPSKPTPPKPFVPAPKSLEPFLEKLSKNHVYITHIDTKPAEFKKKIFAVPVLMNIVIIALIFLRIKMIGPYYMKICFSVMWGEKNEMTMNTSQMATNDIMQEIWKRTMTFMADLLIYVFIWPWPRAFFAGRKDGNPCSWRLATGFKEKEIVVRRSRKWFIPGEGVLLEGPEQKLLFENVGKAVDPMWMSEKTGYLMLNKEWDLDWKVMIFATKQVDQKAMKLEDFKTTIFVHDKEFGWVLIETAEAGGSLAEEEGRRKIVAFKDELTALGKENLFFRWIELVQFESSQPGGFGPDRQRQTMEKAKQMFESQEVDFDKFWAKVGGMKGMPGMDEM